MNRWHALIIGAVILFWTFYDLATSAGLTVGTLK